MRKISVAVADDDERMVKTIREAIQEDPDLTLAGEAGSGTETRTLILTASPDVVVLDLLMPDGDGIWVMNQFPGKGKLGRPAFIVISSIRPQRLMEEVFRMGAEYYMLKPLDCQALLKRIKLLSAKMEYRKEKCSCMPLLHEDSGVSMQGVLEADVTGVLQLLGVPASFKGHGYLRDAIMLAYEDRDLLESVTKNLYVLVARKNRTTPCRVERTIRHAIESSWDRSDSQALLSLFGRSCSTRGGRPTNTEYITVIVDRLRMDYQNLAL